MKSKIIKNHRRLKIKRVSFLLFKVKINNFFKKKHSQSMKQLKKWDLVDFK
jgi:hypothetical protein